MKFSWSRIVLIVACLFTLAGCNSALKLDNVFVAVTEYRPGALEKEATVKLRFSNENVFPLALARTEGKLYLNGTYAGKIELTDAVGLPSLGVVTHDATLHVGNTSLLKELGMSPAKTVSYRLESRLTLDLDENRELIKTASSGHIETASLKPAAPEEKH